LKLKDVSSPEKTPMDRSSLSRFSPPTAEYEYEDEKSSEDLTE
jgi:hypothetical protein